MKASKAATAPKTSVQTDFASKPKSSSESAAAAAAMMISSKVAHPTDFATLRAVGPY